MALEMEPMPRDPRTVLDGANRLPYCVAFVAQHHRALAMLHPHVVLQVIALNESMTPQGTSNHKPAGMTQERN